MFAAAAIVWKYIVESLRAIAIFLAVKGMAVFFMIVVIPFVLRQFYLWTQDYGLSIGRKILEHFIQSGDIPPITYIEVTGIGYYLAEQIGLPAVWDIFVTGLLIEFSVWISTIGIKK